MTSLAQGPSAQEVRAMVKLVSQSMVAGSETGAPEAVLSESDPSGADGSEAWTGYIGIQGGFHGSVVLHCDLPLARHFSRQMFGAEAASSEDDSVREALAEVTNIMGGNIKSLFSPFRKEKCDLSFPVVVMGQLDLTVGERLHQLAFRSDWGSIRVSVFEMPAPDPSTDPSPSALL